MKLWEDFWRTIRKMPSGLRFLITAALVFGALAGAVAFIPSTVTIWENGSERHPSFAEHWQKGYGPGALAFSFVCFLFVHGAVRAKRWALWLIVGVPWAVALGCLALPGDPFHLNKIFWIIAAALTTRYYCFNRSVRDHFVQTKNGIVPDNTVI